MAGGGGGGRVETLTVLFTDLVGSTELRTRIGEERSDHLRHAHDGLLRDAIYAVGGRVVKSTGDGVMATFPGAADAVAAAVAVQQAIDRHNRTAGGERLEVRIGLSVGDVTVEEDGDCFGLPVVEAQRLEAASAPGQILCAAMVRGMARGRGGHEFRSIGELELKGLPEPLEVDEVVWEPEVDGTDSRPGLPPLLATPHAFDLAGRESELARLTDAWKQSGEGPGQLFLLSGEPGIGKTRLVAELAATVVASGGIVLAGRSDEDLTAPYGPVADALTWWATAVGPGAHLGEWPGELVRLVPFLAMLDPTLADAVRPNDSPDATLLNQSIRSWLEATARISPVLLVLDDLHWADAATLVFVRSLFDRSPPERLLVVGTYRDTDLDRTHPLAGVLADLRRHEHVTRLPVAGLDESGVVEFLSLAAAYELDDPGRALARAVWEESSGNPFFVGEILRHLAESGAIVERDGAWVSDLDPTDVGIPEGIREVVGRRLTRLGPEVERILSTAAVVGLEFGVDLVAVVLGDDVDDVLDRLEQAGRAALVDEATVDRWRFAHAIVRETLLSELSSTRRVRQHRKVAVALEVLHAEDPDQVVNQLAHHWGEAAVGGADVDTAVRWAVRAGDRAVAKAAIADAARWYEQAVGLIDPDEPEDAAVCDLLVKLARAQAQGGGVEYRGTMLRAADLARDLDDHALLTDALVISPHTGYAQDTTLAHPELIERLEGALEVVGPDEPGLRARLLSALSLELEFIGEARRRSTLCDEAYVLAVRSNEVEALTAALKGIIYSQPQSLNNAVKVQLHQEATLALLDRSLVAGNADLALTCAWMAWWNALYLGDRAGADTIHQTAQELAGRRPTPIAQRLVAQLDVMTAMVDGDLDRAGSCMSAQVGVWDHDSTSEGNDVYAFTLALEGGYVEAAIPVLEQAVATVAQQAYAKALLATACVESGHTDRANELFDWFVDDGSRAVPDDTLYPPTFGMWLEIGWALRRVDRREAMETWLRLVDDHPVLLTGIVYLGSTDRFRGMVARLAGDDDSAEAYFRSAVAYNESVGAVPMAAAARSDWAELCLDRGDFGQAAALARATLEVIGDLPLARQTGRAQAVLDRVAAD